MALDVTDDVAAPSGAERRWTRSVGRSLAVRNFRMYAAGQMVSMAGTFTQTTAMAWLVLDLSGDGSSLGLITAAQFLPVLLLSPWFGVVLDRRSRRSLYLLTQTMGALQAIVLAVLTISGLIQLWHLVVLALLFGVITALDQPVRQAIVFDLVGPEDLPNGIALSMSMNSASRIVGPALGGLIISVFGVGPCFAVNAASFIAALLAGLALRRDEMYEHPPEPRARGQLRAGFAYAMKTREIRGALILSALFFGIGWEFDVTGPLLAKYVLGGGPATFALVMCALGFGAVAGGVVVAGRVRTDGRSLIGWSLGFAVALGAVAVAPWLWTMLLALTGCGIAAAALASTASARVQLVARPQMRGRVVALWGVCLVGTRPLGSPIVGWLADQLNTRAALGVASLVLVVLALPLWLDLRARRDRAADVHPALAALARWRPPA